MKLPIYSEPPTREPVHVSQVRMGSWRDFPLLGQAGRTPLGKLSEKDLAYWCATFRPSEEFKGFRKKQETVSRELQFRSALDRAMDELGIRL